MHYAVHCVFVMFLLFTLQPLGCRSAHEGPSKEAYDKLELHLRAKTRTRDVIVNMAEIRRVHRELSRSINLEYDPQLTEATKDFIKLDRLPLTNAYCNESEHKIVRRFAETTGSHSYYFDPAGGLTNLELVAHTKIEAYSSVCLPRYADRFREKPKMAGNVDLLVDMFFEVLLPRTRSQNDEKYSEYLFYQFLAGKTRRQTQMESLIAAKFIRDRVLEDNQDRVSHHLTLSDYREHLQEPCQKYRNHYGPDLLDLALFDGEMFETEYLFSIYGRGGLAYVKALGQYKFCETIIADRSNFAQATVRKLKEVSEQKDYIDQVQNKRARGESSGTYAYSKDGDTFKFL